MKTIIVIAAHGAPAKDYPLLRTGILMMLDAMQGLANRVGLLRRLERYLDGHVRSWPRTAANDPYKAGVEALAGRIAGRTGLEVIPAYNEFCAPDIGAAIDGAVARGAEEVIVATTMTTRGGEHSETEIREIVVEAQQRHPSVRICYAWPFDPDCVAGLFVDEIGRITGRQFA